MSNFFERFAIGSIFVLLIGTCLLFFYALYCHFISEKLTLLKSEWECTETKSVTRMVLVGKFYQQQTNHICINYRRL